MLAIPKPMLDALDLSPDAAVDLSIKSGRLMIEPKRRRYSLDELLARCKPSRRRLSREEREWLTSKAVGRELI
jgi:antitoxin component of MazEF toxin-antitoxin module